MEDEDPTTVSAAEQRARTLGQLLNSIGGVVITIGAGLTILNLFINIAPLLAGVGVAGLAISFGAQSLVKDVIGGFSSCSRTSSASVISSRSTAQGGSWSRLRCAS